jgi:dihydrodipicolinate synthase/N-acetylneuraminate lyase
MLCIVILLLVAPYGRPAEEGGICTEYYAQLESQAAPLQLYNLPENVSSRLWRQVDRVAQGGSGIF